MSQKLLRQSGLCGANGAGAVRHEGRRLSSHQSVEASSYPTTISGIPEHETMTPESSGAAPPARRGLLLCVSYDRINVVCDKPIETGREVWYLWAKNEKT